MNKTFFHLLLFLSIVAGFSISTYSIAIIPISLFIAILLNAKQPLTEKNAPKIFFLIMIGLGLILRFNYVPELSPLNQVEITASEQGSVVYRGVNRLIQLSNPYDPHTMRLAPQYFFNNDIQNTVVGGYAYFPFSLIMYIPGVLLFGSKGIFLTNYFMELLSIILIYLLVRKLANKELAIQAAAYYAFFTPLLYSVFLKTYFTEGLLYMEFGLTFLLLAALTALAYKHEKASAIFIGLGMASKLFPAVFLFPFLLLRAKNKKQFALISGIVFFAIIAPFWAWNADNFIAWTLDYFAKLTPTPERLIAFIPVSSSAQSLISSILIIMAAMLIYIKSRTQGISQIAKYYSLIILSFFIFYKNDGANYYEWVLPFLIIAFLLQPKSNPRTSAG